jgi:hypothetical protein
MKRFNQIIARSLVLTTVMAILFVSCSKDEEEQDQVEQMIEEVRELTRDFHDISVAMEAGWAVDLSGCVFHPEEGGMGHHFGRLDYIDGRVNHLEPQILLYEPREDGSFAFIGVEYIVPFEILPADSEAPVLFGQEFHQNPHLNLWALHVWTERENPKGIFYDWNPNVSCIDQTEEEIGNLSR